jgi:uncharacterized protein
LSVPKIGYSFSDLCKACFQCCWNEESTLTVLFTAEEVSAIYASGVTNLPEFHPYRKSGSVFTVDLKKATVDGQIRYACPFYDNASHRCRIYALRPFDCRLWPFFFSHGADPEEIYLSCYSQSCPAVGADRIQNIKNLEHVITPQTIALLKKYPGLVWDYAQNPLYIEIKKMNDLLDKKNGPRAAAGG